MPLSLNEIKSRAFEFAKYWKDQSKERAEKDTFWNEFFNIFGIDRKRVVVFEQQAKRFGNKKTGFIDVFWKGLLLCEHKSKGKDLDSAYQQATDYFEGIKDKELPRYIIVSDFEKFRFTDLDNLDNTIEFATEDLANHLDLFDFLSGYKKTTYREEDKANIEAAELMGKLHDSLFDNGYQGHQLEVFLTRTLFILFAEDTGIFEKSIFTDYILNRTSEDGSDLGGQITQLFQVLNTSDENRFANLDEDMARFGYINGGLFAEPIAIPSFDSKMRATLLDACYFDWSGISPAVFGSLFQYVMDGEKRRNFGAHYTEEQTILKTIEPLFLDDLWAEFGKIKKNKNKLLEFHQKLGNLKFFDPACGCGNFLVITYREIRKLELEVLSIIYKDGEQLFTIDDLLKVDVDQFYGIEIEEFPARIAETALWLMDHIANIEASKKLGQYFARIPLKKHAAITHGNSLQIDWESILPVDEQIYIIGNPPFVGSKYQSAEQRLEMKQIFAGVKGAGNLDYVTAWYIKSAELMSKNPKIEAALVSTNSIVQGEQVGILWGEMFGKFGVEIKFAHKSFSWSSEARGKAHVTVIIIGFAKPERIKTKTLYEYPDIKGQPHAKTVKNINPYLVEGDNVVIKKRSKPICDVPRMNFGNIALDSGHLIISEEEKKEFEAKYPEYKEWIKELTGAIELLYNKKRYCFWLVGVSPTELKKVPEILDRIAKVKEARLRAKDKGTQKLANRSSQFRDLKNPENYIGIPITTSENRDYIPIVFLDKNYIPAVTIQTIPDATLYHFGVLTSKMHMTWVKYTCGRLKSDFRYSKDIVYNNFPFPQDVSDKQKSEIEKLSQAVLDARAKFADSSLADLYDPLTMPPELVKAHQKLDKAIDKLYKKSGFATDTERVAHLFEVYKGMVGEK